MTAKRQKTTSKTRPKSPRNRARRGVRAAYTWQNVRSGVLARLRSKSLRAVARELGLKNHSIIQRIRDGIEPRDSDTRRALGLCEYAPAPVCRVHGVAHGKQCRPRKTFEQNAAEYEAWLKRNLERLSEIAKLYE